MEVHFNFKPNDVAEQRLMNDFKSHIEKFTSHPMIPKESPQHIIVTKTDHPEPSLQQLSVREFFPKDNTIGAFQGTAVLHDKGNGWNKLKYNLLRNLGQEAINDRFRHYAYRIDASGKLANSYLSFLQQAEEEHNRDPKNAGISLLKKFPHLMYEIKDHEPAVVRNIQDSPAKFNFFKNYNANALDLGHFTPLIYPLLASQLTHTLHNGLDKWFKTNPSEHWGLNDFLSQGSQNHPLHSIFYDWLLENKNDEGIYYLPEHHHIDLAFRLKLSPQKFLDINAEQEIPTEFLGKIQKHVGKLLDRDLFTKKSLAESPVNIIVHNEKVPNFGYLPTRYDVQGDKIHIFHDTKTPHDKLFNSLTDSVLRAGWHKLTKGILSAEGKLFSRIPEISAKSPLKDKQEQERALPVLEKQLEKLRRRRSLLKDFQDAAHSEKQLHGHQRIENALHKERNIHDKGQFTPGLSRLVVPILKTLHNSKLPHNLALALFAKKAVNKKTLKAFLKLWKHVVYKK